MKGAGAGGAYEESESYGGIRSRWVCKVVFPCVGNPASAIIFYCMTLTQPCPRRVTVSFLSKENPQNVLTTYPPPANPTNLGFHHLLGAVSLSQRAQHGARLGKVDWLASGFLLLNSMPRGFSLGCLSYLSSDFFLAAMIRTHFRCCVRSAALKSYP